MLRKLPIGIQSFEQIRSGGYVYVDKARPLAGMIDRGKSFFGAAADMGEGVRREVPRTRAVPGRNQDQRRDAELGRVRAGESVLMLPPAAAIADSPIGVQDAEVCSYLEDVGMRPGCNQKQLGSGDSIDQNPIGFDVDIPISFPFPFQGVISVCGGQALLLRQESHGRLEFFHHFSSILQAAHIAFETSGITYGKHARSPAP